MKLTIDARDECHDLNFQVKILYFSPVGWFKHVTVLSNDKLVVGTMRTNLPKKLNRLIFSIYSLKFSLVYQNY